MAFRDISGLGVALVTPFKSDGSIDFEALNRIVDNIIAGGADYIVTLGTTAETPALSRDERRKVRRAVHDRVAGRIPLVIGIGGNCTPDVAHEIAEVAAEGHFDAVLSVVPFYNKPTQAGIYAHFAYLAERSALPLILYNVPGRTGDNMDAATCLRLARDFPNIIGVKEASGNLTQIEEIIAGRPERFMVVSGDDSLTLPLMALGASGVISVVGNAFPAAFKELVKACAEGRFDVARKIHCRFLPLLRLLFTDGNPGGIKSLLSSLGLIANELRLPLVPVSAKVHESLAAFADSFRR